MIIDSIANLSVLKIILKVLLNPIECLKKYIHNTGGDGGIKKTVIILGLVHTMKLNTCIILVIFRSK